MKRVAAASLVLACLVPTAALAGPTVGLTLGKSEAKQDAQNGANASSTFGLFVRGHLTRSLQIQGELNKLQTDDGTGSTIRTGNGALVLELAHTGLVPYALVGLGVDVVSQAYGSGQNFFHEELGVGVEYRFHGGITVGTDVRMGNRNQTNTQTYYTDGGGVVPVGGVKLYTPSSLSEGEYRSMRFTVGIKF